jgi:hypothetical protein
VLGAVQKIDADRDEHGPVDDLPFSDLDPQHVDRSRSTIVSATRFELSWITVWNSSALSGKWL